MPRADPMTLWDQLLDDEVVGRGRLDADLQACACACEVRHRTRGGGRYDSCSRVQNGATMVQSLEHVISPSIILGSC